MTADRSGVPTMSRAIIASDEFSSNIAALTLTVRQRIVDEIPALRDEQELLELLTASIQSNLETFSAIGRYGLSLPDAARPPAASEYARRLAQRGIDPSALLRSYRLGHEVLLAWMLDRVEETEPDRETAFAIAREIVHVGFQYIDAVSVQVLADYEEERVRWIANTNSVRAATLAELLAGRVTDYAEAERNIGHRLRQHHVAVVLWSDQSNAQDTLHKLERVLAKLGQNIGAHGTGLFIAKDTTTGWGWLPRGRDSARITGPSPEFVDEVRGAGVRVAIGDETAGVEGFVATHLQALQAHQLALLECNRAKPVVAWSDPDVRVAASLMADRRGTDRLIKRALGGLATDDENTAVLRRTLRTFLAHQDSYTAAASLLHIHKNTVRYRIDKAVELREYPLTVDRLDLELGLIAREWLWP